MSAFSAFSAEAMDYSDNYWDSDVSSTGSPLVTTAPDLHYDEEEEAFTDVTAAWGGMEYGALAAGVGIGVAVLVCVLSLVQAVQDCIRSLRSWDTTPAYPLSQLEKGEVMREE